MTTNHAPDPSNNASLASPAARARFGLSGQLLAHWAIPIIALALGLLSRIAYLGYQDLWYDEIFSWNTAILPFGELVEKTANDVHPPLYYLLLHPFLLFFGDDARGVRLLSLLCGVGAAILTWEAVRRLFGKPSAGVAALLIAASSNHQYFCGEARPYALAQLCLALVLWSQAALASWPKEAPSPRWRVASLWGAWFAGLTAGLFTHNLVGLAGPFIVVATAIARTGCRKEEWKRAIAPVALGALAAALYFPWFLVALKQADAMGNDLAWMPAPTALSPLATLAVHPILMAAQPALASWLVRYGWMIVAAATVGAVAGRWTATRRERLAAALLLGATLGWYAAAHVISVAKVRILFPPRFAALLWPSLLCALSPLVAWTLTAPSAIKRPAIARVAASLAAWLLFGALLFPPIKDQLYNVTEPTRPQTRKMLLRMLKEENPPEKFYFFSDDPNVSTAFVFHGESLGKAGAKFPAPTLLDELSWGPGTGEGDDAVPGEAPDDILAIVYCSASWEGPTIKRFQALLDSMGSVSRDWSGLGGWMVVRARR